MRTNSQNLNENKFFDCLSETTIYHIFLYLSLLLFFAVVCFCLCKYKTFLIIFIFFKTNHTHLRYAWVDGQTVWYTIYGIIQILNLIQPSSSLNYRLPYLFFSVLSTLIVLVTHTHARTQINEKVKGKPMNEMGVITIKIAKINRNGNIKNAILSTQ